MNKILEKFLDGDSIVPVQVIENNVILKHKYIEFGYDDTGRIFVDKLSNGIYFDEIELPISKDLNNFIIEYIDYIESELTHIYEDSELEEQTDSDFDFNKYLSWGQDIIKRLRAELGPEWTINDTNNTKHFPSLII